MNIEHEYKETANILAKLYKDKKILDTQKMQLAHAIRAYENKLLDLGNTCDNIDHLNECLKINKN